MSPSIWTQCEGARNARSLELDVWRVVEGQHVISTRKLVDTDEEQRFLEELIDGAKPPLAADVVERRLDFLLTTPFRYPPLRHGSRFGVRHERGIFYGSRELETALAEKAYYRLLFLEGTTADLGLLETEHTAFRVGVLTKQGVDLTAGPFAAFEKDISSPLDYAASQRLGADMRAEGVEVFLYVSARAKPRGINVGLFVPAFSSREPQRRRPVWWSSATRDRVEFREKNRLTPRHLAFERADFLIDGQLPTPAV